MTTAKAFRIAVARDGHERGTWSWSILDQDRGTVVIRSASIFPSLEDAEQAGQQVMSKLLADRTREDRQA